MGRCRDEIATGTDGPYLGPEQDRVVADLLQAKKDRLRADIHATNILLHGFPRDIYKLINHNTDAKDIWDNAKMLFEGSELTKDDCKSQLYDEFEHFGQHKGENIHDYYVRFTKLINDMRHIKMTMPKIQLNSKFLYAYLKQHESNANENKMLMERLNQHLHDPLALVSNVSPYQYPSSSSVPPQPSYTPPVTYQPYFPNNTQLDKGRQTNTFDDEVDEGPVQDMAQTEDNIFQADQCNAFDSNVDEAPTAQTMFMANLSSADPVYDEVGPSYDSNTLYEVQDHNNCLDNINESHKEHEIHNDVQPNNVVNTDTEYTSNSNIISFEQFVQDNEDQVVHSDVSSIPNDAMRMIIKDRNVKEESLQKELHSVKMQLNSTLNHYKLIQEEVSTLKQDFKQKENKLLKEFLDMKHLKEKVKDKLYKQDQSLETVHMLCKPKSFYDEVNRVATGYKNPFYLSKAK
ncbi:hypothetical protein Tco_1575431 [Tanacetum coccineum]